jgi:hypothetical protein
MERTIGVRWLNRLYHVPGYTVFMGRLPIKEAEGTVLYVRLS